LQNLLLHRQNGKHQSQLNRLWDSLEQIAAECNALNDSNIAVLSMQQEIGRADGDAELSEQLITHLAVVRQLLIKRHQLRVEQSNAAQCVKMLVQGMIEDRETYTTLKTLLADQRQSREQRPQTGRADGDAELSEQLITHLAVVRQLLIKRHHAAQCVKMLVQGMIEDRETYTTLKTLLADQRQWLIARDALIGK
jgi:hypothetical protein